MPKEQVPDDGEGFSPEFQEALSQIEFQNRVEAMVDAILEADPNINIEEARRQAVELLKGENQSTIPPVLDANDG